jgi:hypothetical protein
MLLLAAFFTPLVEFFDRWDPPGPSNDTEMAVFGLIFALCLVLIVCKLTAALATLISLVLVLGTAAKSRFDAPGSAPFFKLHRSPSLPASPNLIIRSAQAGR